MNVLVTLVCDGYYNCDNYEDESSCNYSATYLQEGESHIIALPLTTTRRLYNATLIQTNATNGFQVVFQYLRLSRYDDLVQIGTGNDPSDIQSVITTINGYSSYANDVYVNTNKMWFAAIGAKRFPSLRMDVEIISIDLSDFFPCSGSNMNVFVTLVCDGYYNCDNYEDESSCNYSATYLQEGESHIIALPLTTTRRLYNATLIQTNATNGFQVVFQYLRLSRYDDLVQIGTGNDPSDIQSVITTINGYSSYADDVYVDTNKMWFAAIGAKIFPSLRMDVEIISIDLSGEFVMILYYLLCWISLHFQCYDPCIQRNPCVYGDCRPIGQGQYKCECQDHYDGIHCDEPSPICQNMTWISPRFERVEFPVGGNGTWANSTGMCPFNTSQANEPIGRALCIGDGITQTQWRPVDNCGPFRTVTDILTEMSQVIISEENADEVSQQVSSVTSNIEDITSDDIMFVAEITSNIVQQNLTTEEVTESITSIASNIAQVKTEELEAAEGEGGAISKFIQAFEEQISRVEVADGGMLNIQQPNVAVQVRSVLADDLMRGLVLSLAGSSLSDLTKSNITINAPTQDDRDDVIATRPDIIAQVNIPPSISSVISSTALLSGSPSNGSGEYVRVIFNVFSTPTLFISKSLRTISADNEGFNRSANSPVISLSIGQGKVAALTESINFTFTTIKSGYMNPMCSFWDEVEEDWSQDGCVLVSGFASTDDERYDEEGVRCACDHLTNFAVIMDTHRQEDSLIETNNILTYIGCCISIFSLLVTLATYLWNKDLRTKQPNQIFICLCLTLLCLYTTFVIMISLDSIRGYREVQAGPCGFLTALVHFFVLSSIAWMGVEGYNTYIIIIVKIVNTYIQNFMIKASLAAWGIPAFIVVLTGAIARGSYAHDDLCFLQFWAQIGGLLIPMSIILLINIVIFILVVRKVLRSANIAGQVEREATIERRETIERVQNAICILFLLSLTWVTGYLLLIPLFSQVAQPIFVVLNSFQGFFIFLLYCVRKPHIRKQLRLTCFDKFLKKEASTSSGVPTKDDNSDPVCMFNPTYDASQVEERVTPPMNKDIQSSTEEQKKDTDRDATGTDVGTVSLHIDASVTKSTKRDDDVSSITDDETLSATVDSTDVRKATEGTDDVASTNNDAAAGLPKDAADGTIHNERSDDDASASSDASVNLPIDSTDVSKGN
ncbi:adhesion G-protein coupled receptor G7 [Strongylocentrotus purpuratus]|uniref:Uncharacterized protein n=1 Tax=Strongylocentrotus purpuratus TaxID=7668 RepID=A0A7M7PEZ1_STRPU|nr:adhesion G-protein coupled receptor G7 [Strongylocentrotus purpuratus]